ncbi:MAG: hypothetical protein WAW22_11690 [Smithellaceae bacterium]
MIKKLLEKIPSGNFQYPAIYGGIILLVVLLGIFPLYRYNAKHTLAVKKIQSQIDEQKELKQVYEFLRAASEKKTPHHLPNPEKIRLPRQDVDRFQDTFRAEAAKSGLNTVSLIPDVKTMAGGSQSLLYTAILKGEFANFRNLLLGLGALPYIDRLGEIEIQQSGEAIQLELKIWIALAN